LLALVPRFDDYFFHQGSCLSLFPPFVQWCNVTTTRSTSSFSLPLFPLFVQWFTALVCFNQRNFSIIHPCFRPYIYLSPERSFETSFLGFVAQSFSSTHFVVRSFSISGALFLYPLFDVDHHSRLFWCLSSCNTLIGAFFRFLF
jgi:hypothetical protein